MRDDNGKMQIHTIAYRGVLFLKRDDIVEWIQDIAATEETDTRNRLNEAADILKRMRTP
jgi:hypothetical protein